MKIIKFDNYLLENKDNNVDVLKKMNKYINKRLKNENILIITYWIGKIFNFKKFLFVSKIEMSEEMKDVYNIYIIIGDKYFNEKGFFIREDICKQFEFSLNSFNDYTFIGNVDDVKNCIEIKKITLNNKLEKELKLILQKFKDMLI